MTTNELFTFDLSTFNFTNSDDLLEDPTLLGIFNDSTVFTKDGDDTIAGLDVDSINGIDNSEMIYMGLGNDLLSGRSQFGTGIFNSGTINMGDGDDTITGGGGSFRRGNDGGLVNKGIIYSGDGNDSISGVGESNATLANQGTIYTGNGNDSITGTQGYGGTGIFNDINAVINTGNDDDSITGLTVNYGTGIINKGTIYTGSGDDALTGTEGSLDSVSFGIKNTGTIYMGSDNDQVTGSIDGGGDIYLGSGDDLINLGSQLGEQTVYGGEGFDTAQFDFNFGINSEINYTTAGCISMWDNNSKILKERSLIL